jgi:hypothetical protein
VSTINAAAVDKGNGERKDRGKKLLPSVAGADRGKKLLPSSSGTLVNSKESTNHVAAIDKGDEEGQYGGECMENSQPLPYQANAHDIESAPDEFVFEWDNLADLLNDDGSTPNSNQGLPQTQLLCEELDLGDNWADTYARL